RIIDNLVELELLDKKVKHKKGKVKGTFFYIKPTTKMDNLQDYDPYDRLSKGGRQIVKRGVTKCHNKDTSITDTSITDNNNSNTSAKVAKYPYKEIIEYLNEKTGKKISYRSNGNKKLIRARINEGYTVEDFKKVIDNK